MTHNRKICFYCGSLTKGGAERVFVNLAEYFYKTGYEVLMVTQYKREDEYTISPGITRMISDITEEEIGKSRVVNFIRRFRKLRGIFRKTKPDLVMTCIGKNNLMAIATNTFLKTKVVISVVADPKMEYETKLMRFLAKHYFNQADGIIMQTQDAKLFFPEKIRRKAVILPNSLNPDFAVPRFAGERRKEIVAVGRLDDNKNHAMLVRAFSKVAEQYPEYYVTIYGDGDKKEELFCLIKKCGLDTRVRLAGRCDKIKEQIYESSIFVLTSDTEGMPNALIEAMALGLTVISTDCPCGGPKDLIAHGENGYLISVRDEEALKEQLLYCLSHPIEMDRVGRNAASIQESMNPNLINKKWEDYFIKLIG